MIVENSTPIQLNEEIADNPETVTLIVPAGSEEAYKNADVWQDFNIVEARITPTQEGTAKEKTAIKAYNLQGIEQPLDTKNIPLIIEYSNGSREKVFNGR